jgi:hypothetical protein
VTPMRLIAEYQQHKKVHPSLMRQVSEPKRRLFAAHSSTA